MVFLGVIAFALFFLSDWNDAFCGEKKLKFLFPLAAGLLAVSMLLQLQLWKPAAHSVPGRALAAALAIAFFLLEVYALLFALPRQASYARPGERRTVCARGVYALCRHPGVLFFGFLAFFLWLCAGLPLLCVLLYTALDVLLAVYEDWLIFPRCIEGYADYRRAAPFLLPTPASMARCLKKRT